MLLLLLLPLLLLLLLPLLLLLLLLLLLPLLLLQQLQQQQQTSDFRMAVRTLDTNQSSQRSRMAEVISTNGSVFGRLMNSLDFVTHSKHLSLICLIYYRVLDLLELEELRPILY